ncbi:hypothetical protein HPB51_007755 [Rhipicephalus microplus]|uniref:Uncharacterized protein n=1 Tax=Rhipicephalus microplus TaxID=6941 RepID=A0A9J6EFU3_RHIMP|nr:hypothetical protein HPB51_007755 [Rhipicephalus microplus]
MALSVFETLRKEGARNASMSSLIKKAAAFTNVSEHALYKWVAEHDKHGEVLSSKTLSRGGRGRDREHLLDDFDHGVWHKVMHGSFKRREILTVHKPSGYFKEDDTLPPISATTIHMMLLKVSFRCKKRSRNSLLIEATQIIHWRRKYLRQIKEAQRQERPRFYTDETYVNPGHTVSGWWVDEIIKPAEHAKKANLMTGPPNPSGKVGRLIITYGGNEDGFITTAGKVFQARKGTGDYHDEMDGTYYEKWFKKLLPNLLPQSANVLDKASYYSVKLEKIPNMST